MKIDYLDVTCRRCKNRREFTPARPLTNAIEIQSYMDDVIGGCPACGHLTADINARDRDPKITDKA